MLMGVKKLCTFFMSGLIALLKRGGEHHHRGAPPQGSTTTGRRYVQPRDPGCSARLDVGAWWDTGLEPPYRKAPKKQREQGAVARGCRKQRHKGFLKLKQHLKDHICHLNSPQQ